MFKNTLDHLEFLLIGFSEENNPISAKELAAACGIKETYDSCPHTRKLIIKIMEEKHVPIGSNSKGYFVIRNEKQLQKYMNKLQKNLIGQIQRIQLVYDVFHGNKIKKVF